MSGLPARIARMRNIRISIPRDIECESYTAADVFDFLGKNSGLTEEFIYNNTNPECDQLPVYTASYAPIGQLPVDTLQGGEPLKICSGEVIIIFRQGYAGRMYIPPEERFFASEHTIPVRVKPEFQERLDQYWFIKHYEPEVLHYVTGKADSGNFSELAFKKVPLLIPPRDWQNECAELYRQMDSSLKELELTIGGLSLADKGQVAPRAGVS